MDILFYSKRDNYSNKVVSQYSNLNNIKFVCLEENKFPSFIKSVPSLFIVNQKKVLLDRDIIDYIETFLNKSSHNNFNQQPPDNNFNQQPPSNNFNQQQQQSNNSNQNKRNIDFTDPNYKSPILANSSNTELIDNYGKDSFSNLFSNLDNDDNVSNHFMIEEESNSNNSNSSNSSNNSNSLHIKNEKKNVFNNQLEKYQNSREDFNAIKRI